MNRYRVTVAFGFCVVVGASDELSAQAAALQACADGKAERSEVAYTVTDISAWAS